MARSSVAAVARIVAVGETMAWKKGTMVHPLNFVVEDCRSGNDSLDTFKCWPRFSGCPGTLGNCCDTLQWIDLPSPEREKQLLYRVKMEIWELEKVVSGLLYHHRVTEECNRRSINEEDPLVEESTKVKLNNLSVANTLWKYEHKLKMWQL